MLVSCRYCGRIHDSGFDCGKKPQRKQQKYNRSEAVRGRYSRSYRTLAEAIKEKSLNLCAVCLAEGRINPGPLEVHHIEPLSERPDLLCDEKNLICLCRFHHEKAEKNLIEKEKLKELAARRDSAPAPAQAAEFFAALATDSPTQREDIFPK